MLRNHNRRNQFPRIGAALFCSVLAITGHAQDAVEEEVAIPSSSFTPPPAPPPPSFVAGTSQIAPFGSLFDAGSPLAINSLFRWGPVQLRPSVTYRFTYSDGLQARPGQDTESVIQEIIPNFLFVLGNHWTLNYTPVFRFYSDDAFKDSVDHSLNLNGATTYENWSFGLSQGYAKSSSALVETGGQTDQQSVNTSLSAGYLINSKLSLDLGLNQNLRFVDESRSTAAAGNVGDTREWSTIDWLNYQIWPKFNAGIGVTLGYAQNDTDMTYEQLNARINWQVGNKLSLMLSGGFETRQFLDTDQKDLVNPLFSASIGYQLFEPTSISLSASRSVNTSYFENQVTENTSVNLGINQRLLGRLNLSLGAGFGTTEYKGATTGPTANRDDDFVNYNARLSTAFLKRATASVFYSVSDNSTGQSEFDYSSTSVGFELGYQF